MMENKGYTKVEHPVLYFTLDSNNLSACTEEIIFESIPFLGELGIDNLVIEVNDICQIKELLLRIKDVGFMKTNVNIRVNKGIDVSPIVFEERMQSNSKNVSLSIALSVDEMVDYIDKNRKSVYPIIVTCTANTCGILCDSLLRLSKKMYDGAIIVKPIMDLQLQKQNNGMTWDALDYLYIKLIEFTKKSPSTQYLMDYGFLPTRLMIEHPCNGYVCSDHTCHSWKTNLPRRIYVNETGDVFPEHPNIHPKYLMGNLNQNSVDEVMNAYANGNEHKAFLQLARHIYTKWVQTSPYRVIPWSELVYYSSYEFKE